MTRLVYCAKCGAERPARKVPVVGKNGLPLRRKRLACMVCGDNVIDESKRRAVPALGSTGKMRHSTSEAAYEAYLQGLLKVGALEELRLCNDEPKETYALELFGTPEVRALLEWCDDQIDESRAGTDLARLVRDVRNSLVSVADYTPDFGLKEKDRPRRVLDTKGGGGGRYPDKRFPLIQKLMKVAHGIEVEAVRVPARVIADFKRSLPT